MEIKVKVFFWMDKIEIFGKTLNKPKVLSGSSTPIPDPFGGIPSGVFAVFAVVILTYYHFTLGKYLNDFALENNQKTSKFFRIYNEIPTIILIVVIFVVIFKPL